MAKTIIIHGIVIPAAWNEKGEVVSIAIASYNEGKYLVADDSKGRQLLSLLRKRVVVNGTLLSSEAANVINIDHFQQDNTKA